MDTKYYQEFLVLAEEKNYVNAANKLFISQSVLTKHIQKMEDELGAILFSRTTHSIALTEYGLALLPYAQEILEKENALAQELVNIRNANGNRLSIGSISAVAAYGIAELLSTFHKQHPEMSMDIEYGENEHLLKHLREHRLDIAFVRSMSDKVAELSPSDAEFESVMFRRDCLSAVVPKAHPMAGKTQVSFEDILSESLMFLGKDKLPYKLVEQCAAEHHVKPKIVLNTSKSEMLVQFAAKGIGIAIMLEPVAKLNANDAVAVIPLEPHLFFCLHAVYRKKHLQRQVVRLFIRHIERFRDEHNLLRIPAQV